MFTYSPKIENKKLDFQICDFQDFENSDYLIFIGHPIPSIFKILKIADLKIQYFVFDFWGIEKHHTFALEKVSVRKNNLFFMKKIPDLDFPMNRICPGISGIC